MLLADYIDTVLFSPWIWSWPLGNPDNEVNYTSENPEAVQSVATPLSQSQGRPSEIKGRVQKKGRMDTSLLCEHRTSRRLCQWEGLCVLLGIPSLTKCFIHLFKVYRTNSEMATKKLVSAQGGLSSHQDRIQRPLMRDFSPLLEGNHLVLVL